MPQKRNPVPVEHLRLLLSLAAGRAETVLQTLHNTPFTDMNDAEGEVQRQRTLKLICGGGRRMEQLDWDLEDIHARIQELDPREGTQ